MKKEKMDCVFSVFNWHINSADKKAKKDFIKIFGKDKYKEIIFPIIKAGLMSVFSKPPTEYTQYFVDRITYHVNVVRE